MYIVYTLPSLPPLIPFAPPPPPPSPLPRPPRPSPHPAIHHPPLLSCVTLMQKHICYSIPRHRLNSRKQSIKQFHSVSHFANKNYIFIRCRFQISQRKCQVDITTRKMLSKLVPLIIAINVLIRVQCQISRGTYVPDWSRSEELLRNSKKEKVLFLLIL